MLKFRKAKIMKNAIDTNLEIDAFQNMYVSVACSWGLGDTFVLRKLFSEYF